MVHPNVVIAGAPKCGTTSVFAWLATHPEVCTSKEKELCFFLDKNDPRLNKDLNFHLHGLESYKDFFAHCEGTNSKIVLESTPHYMYSETALSAIFDLEPRPQIIFIIRKPSERIYSEYQFHRNNLGNLDQGLSFSEFIAMIEGPANQFLEYQQRQALQFSRYVEYIPKWERKFGKGNVHILLFENLKANPVEFMKELSRRIKIDEKFWENYSFVIKNETRNMRFPRFHRLVRLTALRIHNSVRFHFLKSIIRYFQKPYYNLLACKLPPKTIEDKEVLANLDKKFAFYNDELAKVCEIDLSVWK